MSHDSRHISSSNYHGHKSLLVVIFVALIISIASATAPADKGKGGAKPHSSLTGGNLPKPKKGAKPEGAKLTNKAGEQKKRVFTPQIPKANRNVKNKVFLEHAEKLSMDARISPDYQVLVGDVKFRKQGMLMYCDSAHFYEASNSLEAFGNVKMEQGDTLFVYSDYLFYDGMHEQAMLRSMGNPVQMINRDVTLFTDSLNYDIPEQLGYYFEGGRIVDSENELSSVYGQYEPDTKNAEFLYDVELVNPKFTLTTDTLKYNTRSHVANIVSRSVIVSDSATIYTSRGWYNTATEESSLLSRSLIVGKNGQKMTGDTVYYDKKRGIGEAFGSMVITDSAKSVILEGDYGFYDENNDISFATRRARVMEFSQGDTLYMHGDTIRTYIDPAADSTRVVHAYHMARFYRYDMQGVADSISFTSSDSIIHMYRHPIVWEGERQVNGNIIEAHVNDSIVDWARLPEFGVATEHLGEQRYYNQLSGKEMYATFDGESIKQLDVNGNVQAIVYPMEEDSTYNKLVFAESSYLKVWFKKKDIERMKMWPEVNGKAIPLYLVRNSDLYLPDFGWYEAIRPKDKDDVMVIPEEMRKLMAMPEKKLVKPSAAAAAGAAPQPQPQPEEGQGATPDEQQEATAKEASEVKDAPEASASQPIESINPITPNSNPEHR